MQNKTEVKQWLQSGMTHHQSGRIKEANAAYRRVLQIQPNNIDALHLLGLSLHHLFRNEEAVEILGKVLKKKPVFVEAWNSRGIALQALGRHEEALKHYDTALKQRPGYDEAWYNRGLLLQDMDRHEDALKCYGKALSLNPKLAQAHTNSGNILQEFGRLEEAGTCYRKAIEVNPNYPVAYFNMGSWHRSAGEYEQAIACFETTLRLQPGYIKAKIGIGASRLDMGEIDIARVICDEVLAAMPTSEEALILAASIDEKTGDMEQARQKLLPLVQSGTEHPELILAYGRLCHNLGRHEEVVQVMEEVLGNNSLSVIHKRGLSFKIGKAYHALRRYDEAFKYYEQGNILRNASFDESAHVSWIDSLMKSYSESFMSQTSSSNNSSQTPVFIIGMPRSGTTLVEQILSSHSKVFGAGELTTISALTRQLPELINTSQMYPSCLAQLNSEVLDQVANKYLQYISEISRDSDRVVDKMPGNFLHAGLIKLLFPNARIIHCVRDPMDTCLSCYFQNFVEGQDYSFNLQWLGTYYLQYLRLMNHWRKLEIPMFTIRYEDMVEDQETMTRRLLSYCGLDWDEQCMRFFESSRIVRTASYDQVKRPMYKESMGRWKKYEKQLDGLHKRITVEE